MLTEAFSAFIINNEIISPSEYKKFLDSQESMKIELVKNSNFIISKEVKVSLNTQLTSIIVSMEEYQNENKNIFSNHFERWEIEEADSLLFLVHHIVEDNLALYNSYIKEAKYYKQYPSLSSKLTQIANLHKEIYEFTKLYLARAKDANSAYKFMNDFIPKNQEVLKALA